MHNWSVENCGDCFVLRHYVDPVIGWEYIDQFDTAEEAWEYAAAMDPTVNLEGAI